MGSSMVGNGNQVNKLDKFRVLNRGTGDSGQLMVTLVMEDGINNGVMLGNSDS